MFTGIIEETGTIKTFDNSKIIVKCNKILNGIKIGDSIAINGCCQTVVEIGKDFFAANVSNETFKVTNFKTYKKNDIVNLESALTLSSKIGGHIVQGHVDSTAKLIDRNKNNEFYDMYFEIDEQLQKYIIKKGSIAINGISLTIADVNKNIIKIAVIPHTYLNTNLQTLKINDIVNIETDIIGKYVEKMLFVRDNKIDSNFLVENGFV